MGVAGAGKSTVGKLLADELGWPFFDGDEFHSPEAIRRMKTGTPLTDQDREPWLARLSGLIEELIGRGASAVIACSALKAAYRDRLRSPADGKVVRFVYLRVTPPQATQRVRDRPDHFLPSTLVTSQFSTLEEPACALTLDGGMPPPDIVQAIRAQLGL